MFVWIKSEIWELSGKYEYPSCKYDMDTDMDPIYEMETGNYGDSHIMWTQHPTSKKSAVRRESHFLVKLVASFQRNLWPGHKQTTKNNLSTNSGPVIIFWRENRRQSIRSYLRKVGNSLQDRSVYILHSFPLQLVNISVFMWLVTYSRCIEERAPVTVIQPNSTFLDQICHNDSKRSVLFQRIWQTHRSHVTTAESETWKP